MLKRLRTETKQERNERLNQQDRKDMERILAEVANLREAGHTARMGWEDGNSFTGIVAQVACIMECGQWVRPLYDLPHPATCQACYLEGKEEAGV